MTYGHSIAAPTESSALSRARTSWGSGQAWRQLDAGRRLQLIEQALRTTDGLIDEFSAAL